MTIVALTNFMEVTNARGTVEFRFQNSKPGEVIAYRGFDYPYLSFACIKVQQRTATVTTLNLHW